MARIYLDFESFERDHIEVGAILTFSNQLVDTFHELIWRDIKKPDDFAIHARYSHCIDPVDLDFGGVYENLVKSKFLAWIKKFNFPSITIAGHGPDVCRKSLIEWIPELDAVSHLSYEQVNLPEWIERKTADYHLSAHTMKEVAQYQNCHKQNHRLDLRMDFRVCANHSQIARYMHGYHCALFDSFELAFYERSIPLFCCENDFSNVYCLDNTPYLKK